MQIQQATAKLFFEPSTIADQEPFIEIFHRWIRDGRPKEHLLIDVADYRHVPKGPGVMLIAHEAHIGLDAGRGELGILYTRKRDQPGDARDKLREALQAAVTVARAIESEFAASGNFRVRTDKLQLGAMSRLFARNDDESFRSVEPAVRDVLRALGYGDATLTRAPDSRRPLLIDIEAISEHPGLTALGESLQVL